MNQTRFRSTMSLVAFAWAGSAAFLFVTLQPFLLSIWVAASFSHTEASIALSAGNFGGLIGNLVTIVLLGRVKSNRTLIAIGSLTCAAPLVLLGAISPDTKTLWSLVLLSGFGGGMLGASNAASVSALPHPGRVIAIIIVSQIVSGGIVLGITPDILAVYGNSTLFYAAAFLIALTVIFLPFFAEPKAKIESDSSQETQVQSGGLSSVIAVPLLLSSLTLLYVGNNAVWANLDQIGQSAGINASDIGLAFAIGQIPTLGFVIAAGIFDKGRKIITIPLGGLITAAAMLLFIYMPTMTGMTIGVSGFLGGFFFAVPYYMAEFASRDVSGRLMAWGQSAMMTGLIVGPLAATYVVDIAGMTAMIWSAIAITGLGIGLACCALARPRVVGDSSLAEAR